VLLLPLGHCVDPIPQRNYALGSAERKGLEAAISKMQSQLPFEVPCVINGKPVSLPTALRNILKLTFPGQNR
jgi:hypothetical protein